jgi:NADH:ubiquinone oxidoreductase subunit 6 (subunit J)
MLEEIVQLSLMIASCIFAILTVELKDLLHTVLSLAAMAISASALQPP